MTDKEINLIEDLIYKSIQYQLRGQAPKEDQGEILNDISDIKRELLNANK